MFNCLSIYICPCDISSKIGSWMHNVWANKEINVHDFFFLKSMFKVFSFSIFLFFCKSIFKKWFVIKTRLENRWEFENENPLPLSGNAKIKILFCHNLLIKKTDYFSFSWKIQTIVTRREHSLQLEFCPQSTDTLNNYSPYKLITTFFVLPFGTSNVE